MSERESMLKTKLLFLAMALMANVACQSTKSSDAQSKSELAPFNWQISEFALVDVESTRGPERPSHSAYQYHEDRA